MKKNQIILASVVGFFAVVALWLGGSYNALVSLDEKVRESWSQVENVYQRRLDLIPNLVETVKGYAAHESQTFRVVTEARARAAGSLTPTAPEDPNAFAKFQESQAALGSVLSRLMVVVEQYPDLRANENFLSLQAQLEGTENRIAVERARFNEASQLYNTTLRRFPTNLIGSVFGFKLKAYFTADSAASTVPAVKF